MLSSTLLTFASALVLLAAATPLSPAGAQAATAPAGGWFVEGGLATLRVPESAATNVTTRGTTPLATVRAGRIFGPQLSLSASLAYGEVNRARHDVYQRPVGPTRTETYDYRALIALVGGELRWPASRAEVFAGLEIGWVRDGWWLVEYVDPAGFPPPQTSVAGGVAGAAAVGLRYRLRTRVALSGALRIATGSGMFESNGGRLIPEVGLRWRF
jgi:hypothetical protein